MKCKIRWIDCAGNPTPDENEAIGYAVIGTDRIPICAEHFSGMNHARSHFGPCNHVTRFPHLWNFEPLTEQP